MSTIGTPTNEDGAAAGGAAIDDEWRSKVQQSYRNAEVRQIAKVLASLEPGASEASKLRLAMQFEDSIFKQVSSLADYHKRLTKRLKKLQKTYVPVVDASATTQQKERQIHELIRTHGDDLKYVVTHATESVKEMREKYGDEKAVQLQQHIDGVKLWAADLGLVVGYPLPNYSMSDTHLEKLTSHLEKRLQNVRSHVVKLVHPDTFLQESLQKMQDEFKDKGRAVRVQAENMRKRYEQYQQGLPMSSAMATPEEMLARAIEQADKPVPDIALSTNINHASKRAANKDDFAVTATGSSTSRTTNATTPRAISQNELDSRVRTALLHLEKMRATSSIVLAYLCAPDKYSVPSTALAKAHSVAVAGIEVVQDVMREHRQYYLAQQSVTVHLHDAWLKPLIIPIKSEIPDAMIMALDVDVDETTTPAAAAITSAHVSPTGIKRLKVSHSRPFVFRSRVLLTPGRVVPCGLVLALQSKGAKLVQPPPLGAGSYVHLQFEEAFTMMIYFVPLLVTLRAVSTADSPSGIDRKSEDTEATSASSWTPLHHGLAERGEELVVGALVKGSYETVGFIVEERLRDASAHATHALRTCFSNAVNNKDTNGLGDSNIEMIEASALLEFVQLARSTYMPNWSNDAEESVRK